MSRRAAFFVLKTQEHAVAGGRLYRASVLTHSFASGFCDGERFFGSAVLCEDGFGAGGPLEGLWVLVSMLDPLVNRGLEFGDVVEGILAGCAGE
ncbi:hypothetical protein ABIF66_011555 [Bradyrhizobium japonicum]